MVLKNHRFSAMVFCNFSYVELFAATGFFSAAQRQKNNNPNQRAYINAGISEEITAAGKQHKQNNQSAAVVSAEKSPAMTAAASTATHTKQVEHTLYLLFRMFEIDISIFRKASKLAYPLSKFLIRIQIVFFCTLHTMKKQPRCYKKSPKTN